MAEIELIFWQKGMEMELRNCDARVQGPVRTGTVQDWNVLRTRYRMESVIEETLRQRDVTCFLPRIPEVRQWRDRKKKIESPLFPGYVFVKPPFDSSRVQFVRGGLNLIVLNGKPARIPEKLIQGIRTLTETNWAIEVEDQLRFGEWVQVIEGPLKGIQGELVQYKGKERLVLNAEMLGKSVNIEINKRWIMPVTPSAGRS